MFFRKKIQVVVIDDDAGLRKIVEHNLSKDGFEVYQADSGESGIELIRDKKPKVVLLDIVMPDGMDGMDGIETLRILKRDMKLRTTTVIMLTTESSIGTIDQAYALGAVGYITKPIRGRQLGKTIKDNLKKAKGK